MITITDNALQQLKENLERGSWIPWDKFLNIKKGDTVKIPKYNEKDELIGYQYVDVNGIFIKKADYEYYHGVTMGRITGKYTLKYLNKDMPDEGGGMTGVLSVKTDEIKNFNSITAKNIYKDNIKVYNSFDDVISKWVKENNIERSELNYETMKQVIEDIGESWYRQSLGKTYYH